MHPFAGYIVIFIDFAWTTADKLVSTVQGINIYSYRENTISMNVLNGKKISIPKCCSNSYTSM